MVFLVLLEMCFPYLTMIFHIDHGERMFPSSSIGGTGNRASPILPPPPPIIHPEPRFLQAEKYKVTQALLASKHQDGKFVCAHVLIMKSHIDRLGMLSVIFPKELAIDLVLLSLLDSYSQFIKDFYERDHDVTLIDLTYMLIAAEAEMLKSTIQANMFEGSASQVSMDIENGNIGSPEKVSLPNGKGIGQGQTV
ncbi:hypothetical protein Lser_V15G36899 [Lactuca serriola]